VREIDRQERVLGSSLEGLREGDVVVGDTVRFGRIGDVLAEEVDRAREPRRGEAIRADKGILGPRTGDVAPCPPVGAPLATGEGAHSALPLRARREREQDAPSG
jgi:hypothetical protein